MPEPRGYSLSKKSWLYPTTRIETKLQWLYIWFFNGIGAVIIDVTANGVIAYFMYKDVPRGEVGLWTWPNTIAGDLVVTAFLQGGLTVGICGALVWLELREGKGWFAPVHKSWLENLRKGSRAIIKELASGGHKQNSSSEQDESNNNGYKNDGDNEDDEDDEDDDNNNNNTDNIINGDNNENNINGSGISGRSSMNSKNNHVNNDNDPDAINPHVDQYFGPFKFYFKIFYRASWGQRKTLFFSWMVTTHDIIFLPWDKTSYEKLVQENEEGKLDALNQAYLQVFRWPTGKEIFHRLVDSVARGVIFGYFCFLVSFPISLAILIPIENHNGGYLHGSPDAWVIKIVFGGVLGIATTPLVCYITLCLIATKIIEAQLQRLEL